MATKQNQARVFRIVLMCALALALAVPVTADVHMKTSTQVQMEGMPAGIPPGMDTLDVWLNEHHAALSIGPMFTLLCDAEKRELYFVDHTTQNYSVFKLDIDETLEEQAVPLKLEMDSVYKFVTMIYSCMLDQANITSTPTGQSQELLGRTANSYNYSFSLPVMWGSWEVWIDESTTAFQETSISLFENLFPGVTGLRELVEKYTPVAGLQLESVGTMTMFGMTISTHSVVTDYAEGPAPPNIYDIPAGYTEQESAADQYEGYDSAGDYDDQYDDSDMDDNDN